MASTKHTWNRNSEAFLLELVREKRLLWDPKDKLYHKTKLRQEAFKSVAAALEVEFPELGQLNGDQIRIKFKNLRTYFLHQRKKIRDAPSGSAGCPGIKWPLYDAATYLVDVQDELTSSKSTYELPSNMREDSDVKTSILREGNIEGGIILEEYTEDGIIPEAQLTISEDDKLYSSSSSELTSPPPPLTGDENHLSCTPIPALPPTIHKNQPGFAGSTTPLSSKRKRTPKTSNPVDTSIELLSDYLRNKQSSNNTAANMGRFVESVAEQMPLDKQLKLMIEICKVIERVNNGTGNHEG